MRLLRLERWQRGLVAAVVAASLAIAGAAYFWRAGEETRALRRLPAEQRLGIYQRTMENLRTILRFRVRDARCANFAASRPKRALRFRECDEACRVIARRHMSLPRP